MSDLWLKHVRQEGLVVSQAALTEVPLAQDAADSEIYESCRGDFWRVADKVLRWPANLITTRSNSADLCTKRLTELGVTLIADAALLDTDKASVRLLIRTLGNQDPDAKGAVEGWEGVSHQQAFERLLRETGVSQGVLVTHDVIRLTYAPVGETPGYLEWPIDAMATTAGRPMLGGLKLLLARNAIWGGAESRLDGILKRSREHQNTVSTKLAEQVLGALYTLMRGFTVGIEARETMGQLADKRPQHVYEGLLTVLLRLVFVLYAEDRDLIPSREDEAAKRIYDNGYSIRDLFARLEEDRSQYPDTMEDRYGAWGRILALSRLIYNGAGVTFMHARRGKLFDPAAFPFLEGVFDDGDAPQVLPISDGCIHEVLTQLLILGGERLSYKTLDVEQIGSVYETVMGFVVTRTKGQSVALKVKPNAGSPSIPAFVNLEALLAKAGKDRSKYLKDELSFDASDAQSKALKEAKDIPGLLAAIDRSIDERASPGKRACPAGTIVLQPTDERRQTGSHYTPRSLTAPIVADALMPILDQLGDEATPDEVLALKVCDPAMGSGAFLVEACRALGERLEQAWKHHPHLLPDDARDDPHVFARREVAKRCLYGVDKNAMATDLAKLSLWLITLARDEDFSFLDHALKTGDSLVGLTTSQIKALTWDEDTTKRFLFAQAFDKAIDEALETRRAIRSAPDNITFEIQASRLKTADKALEGARLAGDAVVGVFFSEKKDRDRKSALSELHNSLTLGSEAGWARAREHAQSLARGEHPIRPFHWQIEFPEVFAGVAPGFHAMIGNPPFAGKNTVSAGTRTLYPDWLKVISPGAHGNADLVTHFFRRAYGLIREGGTFGLIATNTIGQGDTRESGLRHLLMDAGGGIYRAQRRVKWPGAAAVVVSTVHTGKGEGAWPAPELDGRPVARISAFLREGDQDETPAVLEENLRRSFKGSELHGYGFLFDDVGAEAGKCEPVSRAKDVIAQNPANAGVIRKFVTGEDVMGRFDQSSDRLVMDLNNLSLPQAKATHPELIEIVEERVLPDRTKDKRDARRKNWWKFGEQAKGLYDAIQAQPFIIATNFTATHVAFSKLASDAIFANAIVVIALEFDQALTVLQSRVHEVWARLLSSSMKDDLRYAPTDCFQTFPMPQGFRENAALEAIASRYLTHRADLMKTRQEGLTKTYNRFHNPLDNAADIETLRRLHGEMDDAVLRAYGWDDLADLCAPGAEFAPRFLTEDDEPEFAYQKRLFWPAPFRDKVLARLLALNKERAAAEKRGGTGKKKAPVLQVEGKGTLL
ncbi:N-6 DNA methylase [Hyphobacterium sp. SN044]|uniref:Eco57I restriction-modification methylase domain-containing protein n=1 Tax=Hyphobacterium sp. SN044 TaxID=2912575 RepID=UPI001F00B33A|nr:N-6 DNA methylase [Hyphobacterium sp. SN044]